jgi:hypothetical protein
MKRYWLACATTAIACCLVGAPLNTAHADETPLSSTVSASAWDTQAVDIPIPVGVNPRAITGTLTVDDTIQGSVALLVDGRTVARVPSLRSQEVRIPVGDVDGDHVINLGLRFDVPTRISDCQMSPPTATLARLALVYSGKETVPTTVADFFPVVSPRIDVVVADNATDDLLEAALVAVAALSWRYPTDTTIALHSKGDTLPRTGAGQRVVRIAAGEGDVRTSISNRFGLPTLSLSGSGGAIVAAARALGASQLALADAPSTVGLSQTGHDKTPDTTRTLKDLGVRQIKLSGYGRSASYLGVKQDAFGGPISSLRLHVVGTHTDIASRARAQLDIYLNGFLIESVALDDDPQLDLDISAGASLLRAESGLEFILSALPVGDVCLPPDTQLPLEVHIDGSRTTLEATRGEGDVTGLQVYPQVFGGELPVAIRPIGGSRTTATIDAALLVSALQRAAARPLDVALVDPETLLSGNRSGILVGATGPDSDALQSPLRLSPMRLIDDAAVKFQVDSGRSFAALQSVEQGGRHVLMLGSWTAAEDVSGLATSDLIRNVSQRTATSGWGNLSNDFLIANADGAVFLLGTIAVVPQQAPVNEQRSFIWWFVGGGAVLLLVLMAQLFMTSRRDRRIRALVRVQEQADARVDEG